MQLWKEGISKLSTISVTQLKLRIVSCYTCLLPHRTLHPVQPKHLERCQLGQSTRQYTCYSIKLIQYVKTSTVRRSGANVCWGHCSAVAFSAAAGWVGEQQGCWSRSGKSRLPDETNEPLYSHRRSCSALAWALRSPVSPSYPYQLIALHQPGCPVTLDCAVSDHGTFLWVTSWHPLETKGESRNHETCDLGY